MTNFIYRKLTETQRKEILRVVLQATQFVQGTHDVSGSEEARELFERLGYNPKDVYVSITPCITIRASHDPHNHTVEIDARDFPNGVFEEEGHEHTWVQFYWETGGSALDSGHPHRYICCSRCARRYREPSLLLKFMEIFLRVESVQEPMIVPQYRKPTKFG